MGSNIERYNEITEGSIQKQLLKFFFPILFGSLFQQLYITADAIIVGKFVGEDALASVGGATTSVVNLIVGFFIGMASGASIIIAQSYSTKRDEVTSRAVHTTILAFTVIGVAVTILGIVFSPHMLRAMKTPDEIFGMATKYLQIYFGGTVFSLIYNMGAGILQAVGDSKRPLYILIIASVSNILLDLWFVIGFKAGVPGAAFATLLSLLISAVLVLVVLARSKDSIKFEFRKLKVDFRIFGKIAKIGIPTAVQGSMFSVSNLIIQASINALGTQVIAAWTAYGRLDSAYWMTLNAFSIAVATFSAQNFAVKRIDRVKKSVKVTLAACTIATGIFVVVLLPFSKYIYRLFLDSDETIAIGIHMVRFLVPFYITYIFTEVFSAAIRGTGQTLIPMLISIFGICVTRVLWLWFVAPKFNTLNWVMVIYPITWILTSLIFTVYYLSGKWLKKSVIQELKL